MSFYPPGWDYNRVLNASDDEIMGLTDEQHTTMFNGLSEAGLFDYVMERLGLLRMPKNQKDEKLAQREGFSPYLDSLKNGFKFSDQWSAWGFVIFRTCYYGPTHEALWAEFRDRWDLIMQQEIAEYHNYHPKLDRAIELRKNRWVEDPTLDGASPQEVSRRFDEMWPNLSRGYATSICLMVTPDSLESILNSPLPSSAPQLNLNVINKCRAPKI
ncbi:uncharacterized protein N7498_010589 [Penicillium cinerascens]|uniref:Uncharacterized protein n=1 Tax=Penicillium cinerascens TaxID=70096 RepID=A0A9W9M7H6_9EURO|nr:uncharacterized protein N7498_010589 [Penicillium cinerascens]KAJ5191604.1 hypothetical protein N7498_010589 [Penicillium cinerascens]